MEYDLAARKRLGRAVRAARTTAGYTNRTDFADKMRRSARQVQALENGESGVGPDTWAAAAEALEWPIERVYALLEGDDTTTQAPPPQLTAVSDEELVAEVLRRMKAGEQSVERDTPAIALAAARRAGMTRQEQEEEAARAAAQEERTASDQKRRDTGHPITDDSHDTA